MPPPPVGPTALEVDLKTHATGRLQTIRDEYNKSVAKWKPYISMFADAQAAALKRHQAVLTEVREAQKANDELAFLALTMIGGVAISWVKSLVAVKLYPKYAGTTVWKDVLTPNGWEMKATRHWNEQMAEFFGDAFEKVSEPVLDKILESVNRKEPISRTEPPGLAGAIVNADPASFRTNLESALDAEMGQFWTAVGTIQTNIDSHPNFGRAILDMVEDMYPGIPDQQLGQWAKAVMDDSFDRLRRQYADQWRYFGNRPVQLSQENLTRRFELVIWALWIFDQEYKLVPNYGEFATDPYVIVSKDHLPINHILIGHLVDDLTVMDLDELEEHTRGISLGPRGVAGHTHPEIDSDDLPTLLAWAKKVPTMYSIGLDYTPRNPLGTVRDANSIFG